MNRICRRESGYRDYSNVMDTVEPMYEWKNINWRQVERCVFKLQKRIFKASQQGNVKLVHKLQRLLQNS
jgi:RNA-directed DNA polymerase